MMTRVLVVEDNLDVARSTMRMLRRVLPGAHVSIAQSAEAAIALLIADSEIDTVVCDFDLLGVQTGADVLSWVRANRPELLPRFVFYSAHDDLQHLHPQTVVKGSDDAGAQLHRYLAPRDPRPPGVPT